MKNAIISFLLSLIAFPMTAQDKLFTLEDLNFGGTNYHNLRVENRFLTWWGDQLIYQDAEEGGTLDKRDRKHTLFTLDQVNAAIGDTNSVIRSAMNAAYPYADQPVVRLANGREAVLYNFKTHKIVLRQSIAGAAIKKWSPASKALALVKDHQLWVNHNGKDTQLTTDGSREIVYGDAVHRNEFGIMEGLFWSPDGQRLAFYRMDQSMVSDYPQVNIDERVAALEPDKYPMAGMTSHVVTVGIYDLRTEKTVWLKTADPVDRYFTNITFTPDGNEVWMYELNRDQNHCQLLRYDAATGNLLGEVYSISDAKYVEPLHPVTFLPWDKNRFLVQSQRDGFNHLYIYNVNGGQPVQLTSGPWVVLDMVGFSEKDHSIVYTSNECNPIQRNLYAVNVDTRLRTALDGGEGVHYVRLSKSGAFAIDNYSSPAIPRNIDLVAIHKGERTRLLTAQDPWREYVEPIYESGSIKAADGVTDLYYRMVKPHDFDPKKSYPTVVYVYGGPHAHNVEAAWHWYSRSWETYMAQKGYIVFILDNRGSENRGRDFEQATFRQLGQTEMADQMKGVDYLRTLPYVDMNRLGVHGWSFGGFMTVSLMTNYPDVFKVGVAGGPVIDWKWYEVMYGERYMDTPESNPEGYAKTSLLSKAANLKGRLQIIIGYNDPTVVPQHALSFLKACAEAGTQPDFYVYPGEGHNMMGHNSVHLHERITRYFEDYLK